MQGDKDTRARLEAAIAKHVYGGNVVPFPTKKTRSKRAPAAPPVSIHGSGSAAAVIGSHNQVTINVTTRRSKEDARWRHIRYIKTHQFKLGRSNEEITCFLMEHFGKNCLVLCTLDELIVVRTQLVAIWRHHF